MVHTKRRKAKRMNHILRQEKMLKNALEGRMEKKRPRERMRRKELDDMMEWGFGTLKGKAEDKKDGNT